ncbi:MAG: YcfA family protein [Candidatus Falkowbacteria bacterium GW2011_GWC2_38_22]|uniref:YcfA family protein n=1 Tax=Candidatus Falkowbacteria bacterium GW2011_GWE1_38_31 TaxID=1618638 RepID=A0A0G0JSN8_9BACT|nr:MAG: YcfA family protein [Candidatus Falkowbacteria bacterium GW2011_GWF2_38_1205]KKQ60670.1 MAG: YcfA family protein [Candidatus Falkowbacteria bacterium GW2011_GWC2_38_22]KKQ62810.1 MAG: YcfA family protein [Candidatus Falkowbacteria bacterium GW2011_GWF1_38_22]KKQ64922.1 MAG: YcfA family protein [Candidatus Falkowbacteria bacterium GW2011_GWE2_38_254]KKQ69642.1 MAG: YcfA family protein [Candidatus Falkowbacteria bacterium GW2011_GWE1_38_31]KKQ72288.1 MAG: YcfA family protein [Candidatus 
MYKRITFMPKLPRIKPKQLIKALKKADFILDHTTGSHYFFTKDSCSYPITVPFHNKDLKLGTLSAILKQAKISVQELIDLL